MSVLPGYTPRHARPSRLRPLVAAAGLTGALLVTDGVLAAGGASAATLTDFARLRGCESGGNYAINTGNGYYGAYQFDAGTWHGLGFGGLPNQAAPAVQDQAAYALQARRGWAPWPGCARKLHLTSGPGLVDAPAPVAVRPAPTPAPAPAPPLKTEEQGGRSAAATRTAPWFNGRPLTADTRGRFRVGVQMWQSQMKRRGWTTRTDGNYDIRTERLAARFALQKGVRQARSGEVGAAVWNAAWQAR